MLAIVKHAVDANFVVQQHSGPSHNTEGDIKEAQYPFPSLRS